MSFLLSHHSFLLLFVLVPIILHLLKKQLAKRVIVSSLALLQSRKKQLRKNLKLHQILLLISRILLAACLAIFFLQPLLSTSSSLLRTLFPFHDRVKILLDNSWDKRSQLLETLYKEVPGIESIEQEIIALNSDQTKKLVENPVLSLLESGSIVDEKTYLVSRFYGVLPEQLRALEERGYHPIIHGPGRVENTGLYQVHARPVDPFPGERVELTGVVATNSNAKAKRKIAIQWEDQDVEIDVEPDLNNPAGFYYEKSLSLSSEGLIRVRLEEDQYMQDNEVKLQLTPRTRMKVALVSDQKNVSSSSHSLFYISQFLTAYFSDFAELDFKLENFTSKDFPGSSKEFDLVVIGKLNHPIWAPNAGLVLLLPQELQSVRSFYDEKLAMRSFDWVSQERKLQLQNLSLEDQSLLDRTWSIYRYQQIRVAEAQPLILSGNEQILVKKGNVIVSAFHFHDLDFSGVYHPFFPVYLYRLFTGRVSNPSQQNGLQANLFERHAALHKSAHSQSKEAGLADLSKLLLFFFFIFLILEMFFVHQIEKLLENRKQGSVS